MNSSSEKNRFNCSYFSAFATNKDIRCHFGSSTTSKSDLSSYRFSEGSSLFRKSVLHRIRFGNTVRLKAQLPNSVASSLRTNDIPGGSDRRPSRSLSAYPDQWMLHHHHHHHRLSNLPLSPMNTNSMDNLAFRPSILTQKTLDNIPAALVIDSSMVSPAPPPPISTPVLSTSSLALPVQEHHLETVTPTDILTTEIAEINHFPDCIYATNPTVASNETIRQRQRSQTSKTNSVSNYEPTSRFTDIDSESSSVWTNDGLNNRSTTNPPPVTNQDSVCTCQLLWQLERDTDSIDKFKLFFKRDHLNVDWDYVQGSSEV